MADVEILRRELEMLNAACSRSDAEVMRLRSVINELALPLAELITAYQDADSPDIQDTLERGRVALSRSMA
jgi:hypothetical protein